MPVNERTIRIVSAIAISALMAAIFFALTQPISSADFWWHLATGKWIWNNHSLLEADPFNFMTFPEEPPLSRNFILKQYWFSQILLYLVYLAGGFKGLIILRAIVLTAMFYGLFVLLRRAGTGRLPAAMLVFVSWWIVVREFTYIGLKPQMFSSMLGVMLVLVLEEMRRRKRWALYALPLMMMLWANMHGGYVLGVLMIALYSAGMAMRKTGGRDIYISCAAAILLSLLNPSGYNAFLHIAIPILDPNLSSNPANVVEHISVFSYSGIGGVMRRLPVFAVLIFVSAASFIPSFLRIRNMRVEILLVYILLLAMAVSAARYVVFFATIAVFMTAFNLAGLLSSLWQRVSGLRHALAASTLISVLIVLTMTAAAASEGYRSTGLRYQRPYDDSYGGAVDYLKQNNIRGRMFNDYGPGGFLIWALYPDAEVFSDSRGLYHKGRETAQRAMDNPFYAPAGSFGVPLYKRLSSDYAIELAVLPGCDKVSGVLIRLSLALLRDSQWHLLYADRTAMVLMKETPETSRFVAERSIPDRTGYENILAMATAAGNTYYGNIMPGRKLSMAVGYHGMGKTGEALKWLQAYMKQAPGDPLAEFLLRDINEQLRGMKPAG